MTAATGSETSGTSEATATTATTGATETGTAAATGTAAEASATVQEVSQLPDWAQKLITDVRREAGDYRAKAQSAAEAAQQELSDKIAQALGLKHAADPAKLLEQANATAAAKDAQLVGLQRQIAARDAATTLGANPALLLDTNSFTTKLNDLDPTSSTFATDLSALVASAVAANPHLKAQARAAGASGVELSGGSGEPTQITDPAVIAAMSAEQRVEALNKGQLRVYMAS